MDVLDGYLQNHWTASAAGVSLFRRVARGHADPTTAAAVGELVPEIEADRDTLSELMRAVGAAPSPVGATVGRIGAELGRLKPNGHLVTRSPLTDVVEIEALRDAVFGKRCGWEALRSLDDPRLETGVLDELIERADDQLERLRRLHLEVARKRVAA